MNDPIDQSLLRKIVELARDEDVGRFGDLTTLLLPESRLTASGKWQLAARQTGRFCGAEILPVILEVLAPEVSLQWIEPHADSSEIMPGQAIARFTGPVGQMLLAERTMLNFLQHLSGIATLTAQFVAQISGTRAGIYDTRKTTPGLRMLEKYAVRCGGGHNHRLGLHDAVLIKDNHLAGIEPSRIAHAVFEMLNRLDELPAKPAFVEVECDTLEQFQQLLKVVGINVILLDNFDLNQMRKAVALRDSAGLSGKIELEASGGITLDTVRAIAQTGVERLSIGAITHSAPALDLGLDAI